MRDKRAWTISHFASATGFEKLTYLLFEYGSDVQSKTSRKETALHLAVGEHHEPAVRVLLELHIDFKAKDG